MRVDRLRPMRGAGEPIGPAPSGAGGSYVTGRAVVVDGGMSLYPKFV